MISLFLALVLSSQNLGTFFELPPWFPREITAYEQLGSDWFRDKRLTSAVQAGLFSGFEAERERFFFPACISNAVPKAVAATNLVTRRLMQHGPRRELADRLLEDFRLTGFSRLDPFPIYFTSTAFGEYPLFPALNWRKDVLPNRGDTFWREQAIPTFAALSSHPVWVRDHSAQLPVLATLLDRFDIGFPLFQPETLPPLPSAYTDETLPGFVASNYLAGAACGITNDTRRLVLDRPVAINQVLGLMDSTVQLPEFGTAATNIAKTLNRELHQTGEIEVSVGVDNGEVYDFELNTANINWHDMVETNYVGNVSTNRHDHPLITVSSDTSVASLYGSHAKLLEHLSFRPIDLVNELPDVFRNGHSVSVNYHLSKRGRSVDLDVHAFSIDGATYDFVYPLATIPDEDFNVEFPVSVRLARSVNVAATPRSSRPQIGRRNNFGPIAAAELAFVSMITRERRESWDRKSCLNYHDYAEIDTLMDAKISAYTSDGAYQAALESGYQALLYKMSTLIRESVGTDDVFDSRVLLPLPVDALNDAKALTTENLTARVDTLQLVTTDSFIVESLPNGDWWFVTQYYQTTDGELHILDPNYYLHYADLVVAITASRSGTLPTDFPRLNGIHLEGRAQPMTRIKWDFNTLKRND